MLVTTSLLTWSDTCFAFGISSDIWVSGSRDIGDAKFEFAMGEMKRLIEDGHVKIVEKDGKQYFEAIDKSGRGRLAESGQYSIQNAIKTGNYKAIMAGDKEATAAYGYPTPGETDILSLRGIIRRLNESKRAVA